MEHVATQSRRPARARMTGTERREQLLDVARALFAVKGFEGTSVEEIAARADVSKPVVYEHFGGKEGIYAVIVDREVQVLAAMLTTSLSGGGHPKMIVERTARALLDYIEANTDGFRILVRDSPVAQATGTFSSLIGDVATQVEHMLADQFRRRELDPATAPMYAQMLVGMIALTGQWWLEVRSPDGAEVAAHLVNLAWNGLSGLERNPRLPTPRPPREPGVPGEVPADGNGERSAEDPGGSDEPGPAAAGAEPGTSPAGAPRAADTLPVPGDG